MRTAVVRLDPDPRRSLPTATSEAGVRALGEAGFRVHLRARHDLEVETSGPDVPTVRAATIEACREAFGVDPAIATVTLVSRGTDDDAQAVLDSLGLQAQIERHPAPHDDVAVVIVPADQRHRVPESRLHTALQAALNCEVELRYR